MTIETMTTDTIDLAEMHVTEHVQTAAERAHSAVRCWPDDLKPGEGFDQGDLLLWMAKPDIDLSNMERVNVPTGTEFQLAPGNTQGARHTIIVSSDVEIYKPANFGKFVNVSKVRSQPAGHIAGYVLRLTTRTPLRHPEHPHHDLPCGTIITAGQVDARTLQWAKD